MLFHPVNSIYAGCFSCMWVSKEEEAVSLAKDGKLYCGQCSEPAKILYCPDPVWTPVASGRPQPPGSRLSPYARKPDANAV